MEEHSYEKATQILKDCRHPAGTPCEVTMADGTKLAVCNDCWNAHVAERRAARKAELAKYNAEKPKCDRCGEKPFTWRVGPYQLCGWCKTAVMHEHDQAVAKLGVLALLAGTGGVPLVSTKDWKGLEK